MEVELLYFKMDPKNFRIGTLSVKYHDLEMKCELVYHVAAHKVWIRMPEIWQNNNAKFCFCFWPEKEASDKFQESVIKQIFDREKIDLDTIAYLHKDMRRNKKKKK